MGDLSVWLTEPGKQEEGHAKPFCLHLCSVASVFHPAQLSHHLIALVGCPRAQWENRTRVEDGQQKSTHSKNKKATDIHSFEGLFLAFLEDLEWGLLQPHSSL